MYIILLADAIDSLIIMKAVKINLKKNIVSIMGLYIIGIHIPLRY